MSVQNDPKKPSSPKGCVSLHLRLIVNEARAIGPGKAELLERIARCGSISEAAREMGMSYRRAWGLVRDMNRCFREPLVEAHAGGSSGGRTRLTSFGAEILANYRCAEKAALKAAEPAIAFIRQKLR